MAIDREKFFICIFFLGLFLGTDATISAWATPVIAGAADGNGALTVQENQELNTEIVQYAVTSDATPVAFSFVEAVAPFAISNDGSLTITQALDHESQGTYTLKVKAVDDTPTTGTATITVTVADVNEAPSFANTVTGKRISKNSATGTTITTVTATDQDDGDVITYSIASGDSNSDFTIDTSSGLIKTAKVIPGTTTDSYALVVHAVDDDTPKLTGTISVVVLVEDCSCSGATSVTAGSLLILLVGLLIYP